MFADSAQLVNARKTVDYLTEKKIYKVSNFRLGQSQYGKQLLCTVTDLETDEDVEMYLPKRLAEKCTHSDSEKYLNINYNFMTFLGRDANYANAAILKFFSTKQAGDTFIIDLYNVSV